MLFDVYLASSEQSRKRKCALGLKEGYFRRKCKPFYSGYVKQHECTFVAYYKQV